jgi:hypothetical protein
VIELSDKRSDLLAVLRAIEASKASAQWLNDSDDYLNWTLAAAKRGRRVSALNLIQHFYSRIHGGERYNTQVLLEYLDHAFGKILNEGSSADHAFGLKLLRGHHERDDTIDRDFVATACVTLRMKKGETWEAAVEAAAGRIFPGGSGESAVKAAYHEYKPMVDQFTAAQLEELVPADWL